MAMYRTVGNLPTEASTRLCQYEHPHPLPYRSWPTSTMPDMYSVTDEDNRNPMTADDDHDRQRRPTVDDNGDNGDAQELRV
jgi:hypothetical protein